MEYQWIQKVIYNEHGECDNGFFMAQLPVAG